MLNSLIVGYCTSVCFKNAEGNPQTYCFSLTIKSMRQTNDLYEREKARHSASPRISLTPTAFSVSKNDAISVQYVMM